MRCGFIPFILLLGITPVWAQSLTPAGSWIHANRRIQIEIYPCLENLCGKITWLKSPYDANDTPRLDLNNPNPKLRARPLLGLDVLGGLRPAGEGSWVDGNIYNPDDGKSYRATMSMRKDGDLQMRVYLLLPLLGKTLAWTRIPENAIAVNPGHIHAQ